MTISAFTAAKHMCKRSNWTITNLALQKILYMAHMVYMGRNAGERLVREDFQAWEHGPVIPELYHRVKIFGSDPIWNVFPSKHITNASMREVLDEAVDELGDVRPGQLVAITHRDKGAWAQTYRYGARNVPITDSAILDEYRRYHDRAT